jgi:Receptor family ligand binding region
MLDLCQFLGWTYVSLVYSEGAYGENAASKFDQFLRDASNNYSLCLATTRKIYADATDGDYERIVSDLMSYTHMKVVLLFLAGSQPYSFFDAVGRLDGAGRFVWLTSDFLSFYLATPYLHIIDGGIYFDHPSAVMPEFQNYFETLQPLEDVWLSEFLDPASLCTESDAFNMSNACKQQAVDALSQCPFFWPLINRVYDAVFVLANAVHRLVIDLCPSAFEQKSILHDCIRGDILLRYLQNTSVDGVNGRIQFDSNGNIQENLTINQFQRTTSGYTSVLVGHWNPSDRKVLLDTSKLSWKAFNFPSVTNTSLPITSVCALPCRHNEYIIDCMPPDISTI